MPPIQHFENAWDYSYCDSRTRVFAGGNLSLLGLSGAAAARKGVCPTVSGMQLNRLRANATRALFVPLDCRAHTEPGIAGQWQ